MLPDPLHPALIHMPLALAVLAPLLGLACIYAISKGFLSQRSWAAVVLCQVLLVGSAWLAAEAGKADEARVREVVAERHIEAHEQAGMRFLLFASVAALLSAGGLLPGGPGQTGRLVGTLAAFGVLAAGVQAGQLGGDLVYRHGAVSAYTAEGPDAR